MAGQFKREDTELNQPNMPVSRVCCSFILSGPGGKEDTVCVTFIFSHLLSIFRSGLNFPHWKLGRVKDKNAFVLLKALSVNFLSIQFALHKILR